MKSVRLSVYFTNDRCFHNTIESLIMYVRSSLYFFLIVTVITSFTPMLARLLSQIRQDDLPLSSFLCFLFLFSLTYLLLFSPLLTFFTPSSSHFTLSSPLFTSFSRYFYLIPHVSPTPQYNSLISYLLLDRNELISLT